MATNEAGETLKHYEVKVYGEIYVSLRTCCILIELSSKTIFID